MKNKNIFFIMFGIVLIIGGVIGVELSQKDYSIELTKAEKDALESIGITNPTTTDETCDNEICIVYLNDKGYNQKPIKISRYECSTGYINQTIGIYTCPNKIYFTQQQREEMYNEKIQKDLKETANVTLTRQAINEVSEIGGGSVTITEKK